MAVFETYTQTRQAEDVVDQIYLISPVDNPVASMSKTTRASGKLHEWSEDKLRSAGPNKAVEGADAPEDVSQAILEKSNFCQIMTKRAHISGTLEDVQKYGRDSEMAYQLELRYAEMANDEELAIVGKPGGTRQTGNAGSAGTAREMASVQSQLSANVEVDATGFTTIDQLETAILDAHLATYGLGGNPSYLITNPENAKYIAAFAGAVGRHRDLRDQTKLVNVIDMLQNPYGSLDVILDRHIDDSLLLLDFEYLATPVLRVTSDWPLAKTGDSESRQILRESTVAVLNSEAHAWVSNVPAGLTAS